MRKYVKAVLVLLWVWQLAGPALFIGLSPWIPTDPTTAGRGWVLPVSSLISVGLGGFFAIRTIRIGSPWRRTRFSSAIIIGLIHFALQLYTGTMAFLTGLMFVAGLNVVAAVVRFPLVQLVDKLNIFPRLELESYVLNSILWASVFHAVRSWRLWFKHTV